MTSFESRFFDKFSLNELVKRSESVIGLNCSGGAQVVVASQWALEA